MKKLINLVALASLLFMPSVAWSQSSDCTEYASVPYSTGFEGVSTGSLPDCWSKIQTSVGYDAVVFPCAYEYAGNARNGSVYFEMETHSGQNEIVALPMMQNISSLKLTFWASAQSSYLPTLFEVGVLEETSTDTTFVPVDTITFTTSYSWSSGYNQYTVYFSNYTGTGERIAMRATGNGSSQYTLMMDDFTVTDALVPEVSLPATAVTNINTDLTLTATLQGPTDGITYSWTSLMETAGNATLSYVDNVATINYSVSGIDTVTLTVTNANGSASASVAVRAVDLNPVTSFPYATGFESEQDANWNFVNGSNGWFIGSAANNGGSNAMYISNDNGTSNAYNTGNSSDSYAYRYFQLDAGEYSYSFDWLCQGESGWSSNNYDYLRFYLATVSSDFSGSSVNTNGWNNLTGDLLGQSSWQTQTGTFTITESGLYPVVLYWRNDGSSGSNPPAAIDNIALTALTCPAVTNIALDTAEQDALTFHWTPLGTETTWEVTVGDNEPVEVSTASYTATGLNSNTAYAVSVRAICGAEDTSFATTASFRTACGPMAMPFFEDFDSYANGEFPPCWNRLKAYGTDPSVNQQFHHSGSQAMYLRASNDTNIFCTPSAIPLAGNEIQVRYFAFMQYSSWSTYDMWIKAGVMTDITDMSTFIALDSINYHNFNYEFEEREFNTSNLDPTASYYVVWMFHNNYAYYYGAIDDISITQLSDCQRPATASIGTVGARQADIAWASAESASGYTVYYNTANDPLGSSVLSETTTDTTVTLTGLQPETEYYVWVATNCGGSESDLRSAGTFTTLISCPTVNGLTVDSTTTDGAIISWHPGDVESQWLVAIDSNDFELVSDSTYTVTGLDALTGHTLYVRAYCGDDDTSSVSSINFATRCADATCNLTAYVTDSYNDSWNGNTINVMQAGVTLATIECPSSQSGSTFTYEVCSTAPVTLTFTSGNWASEMGGTISDGGGNTVFTITGMDSYSDGAVLATINTPCPACIAPAGLTVDSAITATTATINWTVQDGQSAWFVALGTDTVSVSEASYTFSNLEARTTYTAYVATDCNGDTSVYVPVTFTTDCANGSCDIIVAAQDSYGDGWNGATLHFFQNGTEVASYSMPSQNVSNTTIYDTALVNVCSGIPVTFSWQTGNFDNEASYTIFDGAGTEVYSSANGGVNHTDSIADACPTCLTPTGVMATAIDSNNITFVWTELDDVAEYLISFNGDAYTTGYNGTEVYAGLTPNTVYTFSVKAVCVPGVDTSAARTITVRTACGVMTLPYTNDFEAETSGNLPSCWNGTGATGNSYSGTYPAVSNTHAHSGNLAVRFEEINGTSIIATEPVPLNGDSIYVAFWGSVTSGWSGTVSLEAGVMTNVLADSTFIPLLTITGASDYALREFNTSSLTAYHDSIFHIAFRYVSNDTYSSADIDDINIRFNEGCMYPANLVATPGTDDVFLEWNTNGAIGTYAVEYRTTGGTWDSAATTTDSSYTVTGLNPATAYEARVGFLCGTDTLWTAVSFQTNCALLPVPYAENFDAYANDVMPPCWGWNSSFATHWDGGVFLRSYHGGGSEYVVVPELDGAISKLKIEFDTKVGTIAENDGILIGVADASGTLLAWLDTIQDANFSRNAHVRKTVYFTNYNMPAGAARVAFAQLRNWGEWALIDNINIEVLPDCYPVDNLVGHNLDDIENTTFSWTPQGYATEWQVYVDTVTVGIDSLATLPDSLFTTVYDTFYTLPLGAVQGGGIYNFFVRSQCSPTDHSGWVKNEFGAGTIIMNQTTDTVEGCGFVVYDNGGPIAGYLANTNTELVIRTENVGSQLQIFGAKFGFGMDAATLTVYDGEGTTGNVLYTYNTVNGRDTLLNTVLATSTTGSMTITFVVNGSMCHTGYELYIRCTDGALCPRPTELQAQMTSETTATATWTGTASNYNFYYRIAGSETWVRQNVNTNSVDLTGLVADTVYDMYVVAICSATDSSTASAVRQLRTYRSTPELEVFTVVVNSADATMGTATADHTGEVQENTVVTATATANSGYHFTNWTSGGNVVSTDNPYTFTLTANVTLTANFEQDSSSTEGIDDIANANIALYPNPATTTVTISGISGQATVAVIDMNGREVHTQTIKHSSNQTITLDLTGYAQGAYFVRITGERINAIRKLIVK